MSDSRVKLGPGWRALPHFRDALDEARAIVHVLWKHPKYGRSREVNGQGTRYEGAPRPMDRFISYRHAVCAATKIILRDKWGEVPANANADEVRRLGGAANKRMRRDSFGGTRALKW